VGLAYLLTHNSINKQVKVNKKKGFAFTGKCGTQQYDFFTDIYKYIELFNISYW